MSSSSTPQFDEYVVRVPKLSYKKYSVMQFNAADCSDPQVRYFIVSSEDLKSLLQLIIRGCMNYSYGNA